jgi:hypothetical protein
VTRRFGKIALLPVVILGFSQVANAQGDKATAEALFSEGRRLMSSGNYATACEKFAASQKLDPALGTSLNLADCYEKSGRTASAWAEFRDAAAAAHRVGSKDREQVARARADALEKQLSRLTLTEKTPHPDQRIARDGAAVDRAVLGTAVPIDPGPHLMEVAGPGRKKWSKSIDVQPGAQIVVELPELEKEAAAPAASAATSDSMAPRSKSGSTQRIAAVAVGGIGVVGLAVGTVFGLKATSNWSDAKSHCSNFPNGCNDEGVSLHDSAQSAATVSTIAFGVGLAGVAGGAILWLTAPTASRESGATPTSLRVGFDGRQLLLRGSFE